jgi:hypothetical protein
MTKNNLIFSTAFFLIGTVTLFGQIPSNVPTAGLTGYWALNGNTLDTSGNGNHGTGDSMLYGPDRHGFANSARIGGHVLVGAGSGLRPDSFTVNVWVKPSSLGNNTTAFVYSPNNWYTGCYWKLWNVNGQGLTFRMWTGTSWQDLSSVIPTVGSWYMMTGTYKNGVQKFYLNGTLVGTRNSVLSAASMYGIIIGGTKESAHGKITELWEGSIDEAAHWNRPLSSSEIAGLYNDCRSYSTDTVVSCTSFTWTNDSTYTLSNNSATDTFTNTAGCDSIVILNLTIANPTANEVSITECISFTPGTGKSWDTSGTYQDTLVNNADCDSIITYNLTILKDSLISTQPNSDSVNIDRSAQFVAYSSLSNATYQWQSDLGAGYQDLTNSGQYFGVNNDTLNVSNAALSNSNQLFRCVITASNCNDTSDIAILTVVDNASIGNLTGRNLFTIFPNPTNDVIHIQAKAKLIGTKYTLYASTGIAVLSGELEGVETSINLKNLAEGVYLISIGDGMSQTFRVVKE